MAIPDALTYPKFWDDGRYLDMQGNLKGTVTHLSSGDIYGKVLGVDSNGQIAYKMFLVFLSAPLIAVPRALFRIGHLLSGQWAWGQGSIEAAGSWRANRRFYAHMDAPEKAPGKAELYTRIALLSIYYFTEALAKLITLPIAIVCIELSALVAIGDPLLARRCMARTEELWSLNLGEWNSSHIYINYLAPCMQPSRIADKLNFYQNYFIHYDKQSIRSQAYRLQRLVIDNKNYFVESDYKSLISDVRYILINIKKISLSDLDETTALKEDPDGETSKTYLYQREMLRQMTNSFQFFLEKTDLAATRKIEHHPDYNYSPYAKPVKIA